MKHQWGYPPRLLRVHLGVPGPVYPEAVQANFLNTSWDTDHQTFPGPGLTASFFVQEWAWPFLNEPSQTFLNGALGLQVLELSRAIEISPCIRPFSPRHRALLYLYKNLAKSEACKQSREWLAGLFCKAITAESSIRDITCTSVNLPSKSEPACSIE